MNSITFFLCFVPILALILLGLNLIFAPHSPYQEKSSTFECGFHSFLGQNRTQFSISFFIYALLFLLFDLELLVIYPYVVSSYTNGGLGLSVMLVFFTILTIGFAFEIGKKALNIDSRQDIKSYTPYTLESNNSFLEMYEVLKLLFNEQLTLIKEYLQEFNIKKLIIGVSCTRAILLCISISLYYTNFIDWNQISITCSSIMMVLLALVIILTPGDKIPKNIIKIIGNCLVVYILLFLIFVIMPDMIETKLEYWVYFMSFDLFDDEIQIIAMDNNNRPSTFWKYYGFDWTNPNGPPKGPPGPNDLEKEAWCAAWKQYEDSQRPDYNEWSGSDEMYKKYFENNGDNERAKSQAAYYLQFSEPRQSMYDAASTDAATITRIRTEQSSFLYRDIRWISSTFYPSDLMTKPVDKDTPINNFVMREIVNHIDEHGENAFWLTKTGSTPEDCRKTYNALKLRNEAWKHIKSNWFEESNRQEYRDLSPPRMLPKLHNNRFYR